MKFDVGILGSQPVPIIVEQVRLAESLGYDTAWITDTHLVCRELWVTLTACALATSRIRLGPGITVPHTRHISVTASAAASLEELAPGRVVVGVGTGGSAAQTMGLTLAQTARTATLEAMATSLRRLTRREAIRFETGTEGRLAWLRQPRAIPIYAAGSGPRMLAAAGRVGDGVIMYASVDPDILRAGLGHVAAGARESGRALGELDVALWAPMSVARDGALARDHARGRVASALRHPLPVPFSDADREVVERLRRGYDAFQHATAASRHRELVPDRLVDLMALAGTPEEVRAQVRRVMTVPEIGRIILLPQVPDEGFVAREHIFTLFAEEVMGRPLC
jgi:5,10-methylenetetrahydromethanopterin reductase